MTYQESGRLAGIASGRVRRAKAIAAGRTLRIHRVPRVFRPRGAPIAVPILDPEVFDNPATPTSYVDEGEGDRRW